MEYEFFFKNAIEHNFNATKQLLFRYDTLHKEYSFVDYMGSPPHTYVLQDDKVKWMKRLEDTTAINLDNIRFDWTFEDAPSDFLDILKIDSISVLNAYLSWNKNDSIFIPFLGYFKNFKILNSKKISDELTLIKIVHGEFICKQLWHRNIGLLEHKIINDTLPRDYPILNIVLHKVYTEQKHYELDILEANAIIDSTTL